MVVIISSPEKNCSEKGTPICLSVIQWTDIWQSWQQGARQHWSVVLEAGQPRRGRASLQANTVSIFKSKQN